MTQYECWRTNEDPDWLRGDNNDTDNDTCTDTDNSILACGHEYNDYCKCNENYQLETELHDYHWRWL